MASPDFYVYAAQQRMAEIEAQRAQALADLAQYKATSDYQSAGQGCGADRKPRRRAAKHRQPAFAICRKSAGSRAVELSAEERHAKPIERMDWQDALDLARTSKYGKDLSHDDPAVAAGYREVLARRARGE